MESEKLWMLEQTSSQPRGTQVLNKTQDHTDPSLLTLPTSSCPRAFAHNVPPLQSSLPSHPFPSSGSGELLILCSAALVSFVVLPTVSSCYLLL